MGVVVFVTSKPTTLGTPLSSRVSFCTVESHETGVSLNSHVDFLVGQHSQCKGVRLNSPLDNQHCLCTPVRLNSLMDFLDDLNLSLRQDRDDGLQLLTPQWKGCVTKAVGIAWFVGVVVSCCDTLLDDCEVTLTTSGARRHQEGSLTTFVRAEDVGRGVSTVFG